MVDLDEHPAPKLRLLKRRVQRNDSASYVYDGIETTRPRVRNVTNVASGRNSEIDVQQAGNFSTPFEKTIAPPAQHPGRQRPLPKRSFPTAEWNSDTAVSPVTEESQNNSLPSCQRHVPQARRASGQFKVRSGNVEKYSCTDVLENESSLIDSVPNKWPPSYHHVAELLTGVGCATVGSFRRFVKEILVDKIVDATLVADESCASPGCIRDRNEAQKIIEAFVHLVRDNASDVLIQKNTPKPALAGCSATQLGDTDTSSSLLEPTCLVDESTSIVGNSVPKGGCPKCGRNVSGRALVMHLKTCHMNVPPVKQVDPFTDTQTPEVLSNYVPPNSYSLPNHASSVSKPSSNHLGSCKTEVARIAPEQVESKQPAHEELPDPEAFADEPLLPCPHCERTFREKVLQRHIGNCLKINKERKQFNALSKALPSEAVKLHKQAEKVEARQMNKRTTGDDRKPSGQMPSWKAKSEAFRNAIKNARVVDQCIKDGKPLSELPAFVPTAPELDDRTQCPHCGRRFGQLQAERHIPICPKGKGRGKGRR